MKKIFAAVSIVLLGAAFARAAETKPPEALAAQLERIFGKKEFEAKKFGPSRWMDEGRAYTTVEPSAADPEASDIVRYDTVSGARKVLVPASALVPAPGQKPLKIEDYAWSKNGKRLLLFTNTKKVWRRNTRGDYWVLDVAAGKLRKLGGGGAESSLMFAKFSPDGGRAAYVRANDLWVEDIDSGKITRLTFDGTALIVNGTSDWVYEEEFDVRDGFRWSPDGTSIAYWHFDTAHEGEFSLINDTDTTYPVVTTYPVPDGRHDQSGRADRGRSRRRRDGPGHRAAGTPPRDLRPAHGVGRGHRQRF